MTRSQATPSSSQMITMERMIRERDNKLTQYRAVMEQAMEALEDMREFCMGDGVDDALAALRECLNKIVEPTGTYRGDGKDEGPVVRYDPKIKMGPPPMKDTFVAYVFEGKEPDKEPTEEKPVAWLHKYEALGGTAHHVSQFKRPPFISDAKEVESIPLYPKEYTSVGGAVIALSEFRRKEKECIQLREQLTRIEEKMKSYQDLMDAAAKEADTACEILRRCEVEMRYAGWGKLQKDNVGRRDVFGDVCEFLHPDEEQQHGTD